MTAPAMRTVWFADYDRNTVTEAVVIDEAPSAVTVRTDPGGILVLAPGQAAACPEQAMMNY